METTSAMQSISARRHCVILADPTALRTELLYMLEQNAKEVAGARGDWGMLLHLNEKAYATATKVLAMANAALETASNLDPDLAAEFDEIADNAQFMLKACKEALPELVVKSMEAPMRPFDA